MCRMRMKDEQFATKTKILQGVQAGCALILQCIIRKTTALKMEQLAIYLICVPDDSLEWYRKFIEV